MRRHRDKKTTTKGALDKEPRPEAERLAWRVECCRKEAQEAIEQSVSAQAKAYAALLHAQEAILDSALALRRLSDSSINRRSSLGRSRRKTTARRKAVVGGLPKLPQSHPRPATRSQKTGIISTLRNLERSRSGNQKDWATGQGAYRPPNISQTWEMEKYGMDTTTTR